MIGKLTRYAYPYNNVFANVQTTNEIQPGKTIDYYRLALGFGGGGAFTKAMLTEIRMRANSRLIVDTTGPELDKLLAYRGQAADVAFLDVPFADATGLTEFDRMRGALDTSKGIAKLTSELKIGAATSPTLKGILYESAPQAGQGGDLPFRGEIAHLTRYPFEKTTGGVLPVSIAAGNGIIVKRMHFFHTGHIIGMEIKQDGVTIHESTKAENEYEQKKWGRVPQANVYTVDFMLDGNTRKALDTSDGLPLEILPNFDAADNGILLVEALAPLGRI